MNKLLVLTFLGLVVIKLLYRPQWRQLTRWFDGVVNALLVAIAVVYALQAILFLTR